MVEDQELWLESTFHWPIRQMPGVPVSPIEIRGESDRGPFYISGYPRVSEGRTRFHVFDLRIGLNDPSATLRSAQATFDYMAEVARGHHWDGAQRLLTGPLFLPALDGAPAMSLTISGDSVELVCEQEASIEAFETQLDALQRLVTFAAQEPSVRRQLTARDYAGNEVEIYRGVTVSPRPIKRVDYRDFPLRLRRENTQAIVDAWWEAMGKLRPIPQLLTSLRNQPGFRETDFLFLATAVDRLSENWVESDRQFTPEQITVLMAAAEDLGLEEFYLDDRPTFAVRADALADTLAEEIWIALRVDRGAWLKSLRRHRNLVAHSDEQRPVHRQFLLGDGLRALLAATDAIVTLIVAKHLGVDDAALARAAERQYVNRISRFVAGTLEMTNAGFIDRAD